MSASAKDDASHQVNAPHHPDALRQDDVGHRAYLCLGSNIRPAENIRAAVRLLRSRAHMLALSTCWETQAVGSDGQPGPAPNFLNIAACIATPLEPDALKEQLITPIEQALGRVRSADKYAPRTIDLDICVFDDQLLDRGLWKRSYLALTLAELLPDLRDPSSGETLQSAAERQRREHLAIAHPEITA